MPPKGQRAHKTVCWLVVVTESLPLMREVAKPQVLTEGENDYPSVKIKDFDKLLRQFRSRL